MNSQWRTPRSNRFLPIPSGPAPARTNPPRATGGDTDLALVRQGFNTLYQRGISEYRAGKRADALASLTTALSKDPNHAGAWSTLGVVQAELGRLDEALACYGKALTINPNHFDALINQGNAFVALAQRQDALESYDRALEVNPRSAMAHSNRGGVLHELGFLEDALANFDRALALDRRQPDALNNRGNVLVDLGRAAEALETYDRALVINPASANALSNRGNALVKLGRAEEALESYEKALALQPRLAEAHSNRGNALRILKRFAEAVASITQALALTPLHPDALTNLGNTLVDLGRPADALAAYDTALRIQPHHVAALSSRAAAFVALKRPLEALASVERALAINPADVQSHITQGVALSDLDREAEALESYDKAISLQPNCALGYSNKGLALTRQGLIDEGNVFLDIAIKRDPNCAEFRYNLSLSKRFKVDDPAFSEMADLVGETSSMDPQDKVKVHFALGKAFADVEDYPRSFHHFSVGNAEKRKSLAYDETSVLETLARVRSSFTEDLIASHRGIGDPSRVPVFIIGMPRSGSTLVEQILSSHQEVHGAGEIDDFTAIMSRLGGAVGETLVYPEAVQRISSDEIARLGGNYVARLRAAAPAAKRVVNKMLGNYCFAGLISLALPEARFIHVRRDPIDTCLSCFTTLFSGSVPYAYDLGELGRYYKAYESVVEGWRAMLSPGVLLDVQYESVVSDLEGQARRIVEHCGLDWDAKCVDFQRNPRSVRTASFVQVRQPLYPTSVGRWRAYKRFLGPLLEQLQP